MPTTKRTLTIDSRDRDPTKFVKVINGATSSDAGDYVVYLPRVYENVVSLRLKSATIQPPGVLPSDMYVLLSLDGLNKIDETASGADRSGYVDSCFAKITNDIDYSGTAIAITSAAALSSVATYTVTAGHPFQVGQIVNIYGYTTAGFNNSNCRITAVTSTTFVAATTAGDGSASGNGLAVLSRTLQYNDQKCDEFVTKYSPAIGHLDRLRVTWRRHVAPGTLLPINTSSSMTAPIVFGTGENTFTLEIETDDTRRY